MQSVCPRKVDDITRHCLLEQMLQHYDRYFQQAAGVTKAQVMIDDCQQDEVIISPRIPDSCMDSPPYWLHFTCNPISPDSTAAGESV